MDMADILPRTRLRGSAAVTALDSMAAGSAEDIRLDSRAEAAASTAVVEADSTAEAVTGKHGI